MFEDRIYYKGATIQATRNEFSGRWGTSIVFPGEEEETHSGDWAADRDIAIRAAKRQVNRAIEESEEG
jgi:hypothetical protein